MAVINWPVEWLICLVDVWYDSRLFLDSLQFVVFLSGSSIVCCLFVLPCYHHLNPSLSSFIISPGI